MRGDTQMHIICNGELINGHSKDYRGDWTDPLDVLPPVGSVIEYTTFDQGYKEGQGITRLYEVKSYFFSTEEDYNNEYTNKVCRIFVEAV